MTDPSHTLAHPHQPLPPGQVTGRLRKLCEDVVLAFWGALRVTRYHKADNEAVLNALRHLRDLFGELFALQFDVSILHYASDFYVNEVRLRTSPGLIESFSAFAGLLRERHISGLRFAWPPNLNALARLISLLTEVHAGDAPIRVGEIARELGRAGIRGIELTPFTGDELEDLPEVDPVTFVRQAYFRAVPLAQEVFERARARRPVALRQVTRAVQGFVDVALGDDATCRTLLILLTGVKNWHGYLPNHAVNTSVLSVAFGRELGLGREALRELGTAAFLADIGNALLPDDVLETDGPLTDAQRRAVAEHPLRGIVPITGWQHASRVVIETALASALHHRHLDGRGYPGGLLLPKGIYHPIIAVCDRYDALTTPRPYRKVPLTPAAALVELIAASGSALHPVVVRAFSLWIRSLPPARIVVAPGGDVGLLR